MQDAQGVEVLHSSSNVHEAQHTIRLHRHKNTCHVTLLLQSLPLHPS